MTTNFTLRLPEKLADALTALAHQQQTNRHQLIIDILEDYVGETDELILGFIELHDGELDPAAECIECGQPFADGRIFIAFTTTHRTIGPVCAHCATTD